MSNAKKSDAAFLLQGSILAVASIISRIIGLIYRIPLSAIIGKQGNDYYGTAYDIYNIILLISSYSIPLAVSKLVASRMANKEAKNAIRVLKGSLVFAVITGGSAMVIVYFGADFFTGTLLKTPMASLALRVLAPVLLIVAVVGVLRGFFQGLNTMVPSAVSQIFEQIMNAIVSVAAAYALFSYGKKVGAVLGSSDNYAAAYGAAGGTLGTALGALTALFVMIFILVLYMKRFRRKIIRDHSKNVDSYGQIAKILIVTIIPVLLSTTIYNISSIFDQGIFKNIVVAQGYATKDISEWWGAYTGYYKVLINVPISIASAMASSVVPSLTSAYQSGDRKLVRRQIHSVTRFIMMIAFPCTVGLIVLAEPIMSMLFPASNHFDATMMMVGGIAVLFYSLSTLSNGLLQGIDRLAIPVKNAAISLVAQALVLVVLLRVFDLRIYAVILANAFYALFMCILNGRAVKKYAHTHQNMKKTYLIPAAASLAMGLLSYLCYRALHALSGSNMISCICAILVAVIVYFVVLLLMGGMTRGDLLKIPKGEYLVRIAERLRLL